MIKVAVLCVIALACLASSVTAQTCVAVQPACRNVNATLAVPSYIAASSGYIGGKLQVALSASMGYSAVNVQFDSDQATPDPYCNHNLYVCDSFWTETAASCTATMIGAFDIVQSISKCFTLFTSDANTLTYRSIVKVTAIQDIGSLRTKQLNRTTIISFNLQVALPRTTTVSYTNLKTSSVMNVLMNNILQEFNPSSVTTKLQFFTSVQYPYSLTAVSATSNTSTYSLTALATPSSSTVTAACTSTNASVCEQLWETTLSTTNTGTCVINANITLNFNVACRAGTSSVALCATFTPTPFQYTATVTSSNFCPNVLFTGALTATMLPYTTETGTTSTNGYIMGQRVFFQITVTSNLGAVLSATNVTSVTIAKTPFSATLTPPTTQGGFVLKNSADLGNASRAVFSFVLSTTTIPNPTEGVEDTVSVTANLKVTYLTEAKKVHTLNLAVPVGNYKQLLANTDDTAVSNSILVNSPAATATTSSSSSNALVVGVAVGAALLALVAIVVIAVVLRRNRQPKEVPMSKRPLPKEVE